jgi:hypothetical protein
MEGFLPQGIQRRRDSYLKVAKDGGIPTSRYPKMEGFLSKMEGFLPQDSQRWRDSYLKVAKDGGILTTR